jgi:hypothetical protein
MEKGIRTDHVKGAPIGDPATAVQISELMRERISAGEAEMERRHGTLAVDVAREVEATLMTAMESRLSYVVLWEQFLSTPDEVVLAVASVIQALMEADPSLGQWLVESLERYRQAATS